MSESNPNQPQAEHLAKIEEEKETPEKKSLREILASLGGDFSVCYDALQELGGSKTFNEKAFLESAGKLSPTYLEYLQRLIKEDVGNLPEAMAKFKPAVKEAKTREYLAELATTFMKRAEFFSRLRSPERITVGGKTVAELEAALNKANINVSDYARQMMRKTTTDDEYGVFTTQTESEATDLVRLTVRDLFSDNNNHSTAEIYKKAQELGLKLCPAEVGPAYRLAYTDQPLNEWLRIVMKPISDPDRRPDVFALERLEGGLWLRVHWADPAHAWDPGSEFVFRLPSSSVPASNT